MVPCLLNISRSLDPSFILPIRAIRVLSIPCPSKNGTLMPRIKRLFADDPLVRAALWPVGGTVEPVLPLLPLFLTEKNLMSPP